METRMLEADGRAVTYSTPDQGRRVAGAVLALIGTWIAWQIVRAIVANRASTHAAWTAYVPVVLVFGAVAMAFFIPGALMLLYRRSVRLDLASREVTESQLYLGYRRTRSYPLSTFRTIVLARRTVQRGRRGSSRSGKSHSIFVVELTPKTGKPLNIAIEPQESPAREVAVRLVALTGLTLEDKVERERKREEAGLDSEDDGDDE